MAPRPHGPVRRNQLRCRTGDFPSLRGRCPIKDKNPTAHERDQVSRRSGRKRTSYGCAVALVRKAQEYRVKGYTPAEIKEIKQLLASRDAIRNAPPVVHCYFRSCNAEVGPGANQCTKGHLQ